MVRRSFGFRDDLQPNTVNSSNSYKLKNLEKNVEDKALIHFPILFIPAFSPAIKHVAALISMSHRCGTNLQLASHHRGGVVDVASKQHSLRYHGSGDVFDNDKTEHKIHTL